MHQYPSMIKPLIDSKLKSKQVQLGVGINQKLFILRSGAICLCMDIFGQELLFTL